MSDHEPDAILIYDGDCPFCSRYVRLLRLREVLPSLELHDARSDAAVVEKWLREGYDLNEGMLLVMRGRKYHGADCINALALMSSPVGFFNRVNACVFRSRSMARLLYPVLRTGRNFTLMLLGRSRLEKSE